MYCDAHNLYVSASIGDLFGQLMREDPSTIKGAEILMLGEMLTLPQNFGWETLIFLLENLWMNKSFIVLLRKLFKSSKILTVCVSALHRNIFLGETFSSYISVHNDSNQVVKDILVKVLYEKRHLSNAYYPLGTEQFDPQLLCCVMWCDLL